MYLFHAMVVIIPIWNGGNALMEWNAKVPIWPPFGSRIASDLSRDGTYDPPQSNERDSDSLKNQD